MKRLLSLKKVDLLTSPSIENWLSTLRDKDTDAPTFKKNADNLALAIGIELANQLPMETRSIITPIASMQANFIKSEQILLVTILRSAYPMCLGMHKALPNSLITVVDIKRNEKTALPILYYDGLPKSLASVHRIIVPDPMLATGGSASMILDMLIKRGAKHIQFVSLVAAHEGIERITRLFPQVSITTCAIDKDLNAKKYIIPGLGDFGDRYFDDEQLTIEDSYNHKILHYRNGRLSIE